MPSAAAFTHYINCHPVACHDVYFISAHREIGSYLVAPHDLIDIEKPYQHRPPVDICKGCPECLYGISFDDLNSEQKQHPALVEWEAKWTSVRDANKKNAEDEYAKFRMDGDSLYPPTIAPDISRQFWVNSHMMKYCDVVMVNYPRGVLVWWGNPKVSCTDLHTNTQLPCLGPARFWFILVAPRSYTGPSASFWPIFCQNSASAARSTRKSKTNPTTRP